MWKQKVVVACMVPQNFIRENNSEDSAFAWFACDPHFVPTVPEWYNRYAAPLDGSTTEANAATMDVL